MVDFSHTCTLSVSTGLQLTTYKHKLFKRIATLLKQKQNHLLHFKICVYLFESINFVQRLLYLVQYNYVCVNVSVVMLEGPMVQMLQNKVANSATIGCRLVSTLPENIFIMININRLKAFHGPEQVILIIFQH